MQVHLTLKSTNRKTGPIPVSTTSEETCPTSCPFFGRGCYASQGPLRLHWRKVSDRDRGSSFSEFLNELRQLPSGQLWRHNQAGDLPGKGEKINSNELGRIRSASKNLRGFTYTHKPVEGNSITAKRNRTAIQANNCKDFTINLSANGIEHADRLVKLGIAPVTTVLPSNENRKSFKSPGGFRVTVCPATYDSSNTDPRKETKSITCANCQLCAIPNRKSIIGFPAHGSQLRIVDATIRNMGVSTL